MGRTRTSKTVSWGDRLDLKDWQLAKDLCGHVSGAICLDCAKVIVMRVLDGVSRGRPSPETMIRVELPTRVYDLCLHGMPEVSFWMLDGVLPVRGRP
jgi:hypothetical protein